MPLNLRLIIIAIFFTLSACNPSPSPQSQTQPQPQVQTQNVIPQPNQNTNGECTADASWFNGQFDPKTNADSFNGTTKCDFHRFAWQTFIWLTAQVSDGKVRFETLYSDDGIQPDAKPGNHVLGGVNQAGSNAILVDQNGRAVYTTIMINDIYRDFVIQNKLNTAQGMLAADPSLNFPNGAMSLKAAWKIVQADEDSSDKYTINAPVQMLTVTKDNLITADNAAATQNLKVALVGFHIAVYVNNHPEAIWATFEQRNNAPAFGKNQKPTDPVSDKNFTFYKANTLASECNVNNNGMNDILKLDPKTQIMQKITQACLQFPFGTSDSSPSPQENIDDIIQLNASVHQLMPAQYAIWKNYDEVGAVWFNTANDLHPNWSPSIDASMLTGSTRLSNSTIETFTQAERATSECFGCHQTMPLAAVSEASKPLPGLNINTSHVLLSNYANGTAVKR